MTIGMNVWIWGPPLWEILQASSFLLDKHQKNGNQLFSCLKEILPCIYCRQSYNQFLSEDAPPKRNYAEWCYELHKKVNKKLNIQKIEAFLSQSKENGVNFDEQQVHQLVTTQKLFSEPDYVVVQKRFLVQSDELFLWRSLSIVLLAFFMSDGPQKERDIFIREIQGILKFSNQANKNILIKTLDKLKGCSSAEGKQLLDEIKYGSSEDSPSQFIKAGACINKTCK